MTTVEHITAEAADSRPACKLSLGLKTALLGGALILLSACATTTPYQQATKPGAFNGYSQTLLEDDRARVSFGGNSLTDRETVENYLLYRAAELSRERGYEHFVLLEQDTERDTRLRSTGSSFNNFNRFGGSPFFRYNFIGAGGRSFSRFGGFGRSGFGSFGRRGFGGSRFGFGGGFNNFDVREVTKYRAIAEVKFGNGPAPDDPRAFETEQVIRNLGPTIVYPDVENDKAVSPEISGDNI